MRTLVAALCILVIGGCSSSSDTSSGGTSDGGRTTDSGRGDSGSGTTSDGGATACSGTFSGAFDAMTSCKIDIGGAANKESIFIAPLGPSAAQNIVINLYPSSGALAVTSYSSTDLTTASAIQTTGPNSIVYGAKPPDQTINLVLTSVDPTPPAGELLPVTNTHGTLDATLISGGDAGGNVTLHVTF